jgi:inositol-phosphate transport system ATP-binding protein
VSFVETQGRENLYDVKLGNGSVLRSIQPVRDDVKVGDTVNWGAVDDKIMVFAEDGTRL